MGNNCAILCKNHKQIALIKDHNIILHDDSAKNNSITAEDNENAIQKMIDNPLNNPNDQYCQFIIFAKHFLSSNKVVKVIIT